MLYPFLQGKISNMYYQIPLRITRTLADELNEVSNKTNINKSSLIRIAIQKLLIELNESGIPQLMNKIKTQSISLGD